MQAPEMYARSVLLCTERFREDKSHFTELGAVRMMLMMSHR